jgi:hypothetical protein
MVKHDRKINTKLLTPVVLEPVKEEDKTIFLAIRNVKKEVMARVESMFAESLIKRGYRVVDDLDKAHYFLQISILTDKFSRSAGDYVFGKQKSGTSSYGTSQSALDGADIGHTAGTIASGGAVSSAGTGTLAGAAVGMIVDSAVKDVFFMIVSDVQIDERLHDGKIQQVSNENSADESVEDSAKTTTNKLSNTRVYKTRAASIANQANLKVNDETVVPMLHELADVIAGIFQGSFHATEQ